jgi:hypothetical protein
MTYRELSVEMYVSSALQIVVAKFEAGDISGLTLFQEQRSSAAMKGMVLFLCFQVNYSRRNQFKSYKH